jgi:hypothetical protein
MIHAMPLAVFVALAGGAATSGGGGMPGGRDGGAAAGGGALSGVEPPQAASVSDVTARAIAASERDTDIPFIVTASDSNTLTDWLCRSSIMVSQWAKESVSLR